jgi:hypothetical protein
MCEYSMSLAEGNWRWLTTETSFEAFRDHLMAPAAHVHVRGEKGYEPLLPVSTLALPLVATCTDDDDGSGGSGGGGGGGGGGGSKLKL